MKNRSYGQYINKPVANIVTRNIVNPKRVTVTLGLYQARFKQHLRLSSVKS